MPKITNSPDLFKDLLIDVIKASQDGFAIFDHNYVLIFCNHRFANLFGLKVIEAEGLSFTEIIRKSHASGDGIQIENGDIEEFIRNSMSAHMKIGFRTFESEMVDDRWIKVSRLITQDRYVFVYNTDITDLKNTESELRQALEHVEKLAATDPLTGISNRRHFVELG